MPTDSVHGNNYLTRTKGHGGTREKASRESVHLKSADVVASERETDGRTARPDTTFAQTPDKIVAAGE
jgi:hypothetical protein